MTHVYLFVLGLSLYLYTCLNTVSASVGYSSKINVPV